MPTAESRPSQGKPETETPRTPLVLISGMGRGPNAELAEWLRADDPGTAVIHHDLRQIHRGVVRRRLQLGARDQLTVLELAHGCVSCTLREDLLPLLRTLTRLPEVRRIAVRLDESMEPEPVSWALEHVLVGDRPVSTDVDLRAVLTVLDRGTWLADATGEDTLDERGLRASPEDERTVAQVALSQVEFADLLVLTGTEADAWSTARTTAVLDRVAPAAVRLDMSYVDGWSVLETLPPDARRGEVTDMHGPLLAGQPPLHADCGIDVLCFTAQRPFHPQRLHEAIDLLLEGVVRTRGRVWLASQPDAALWLESAGGGLGVGQAGPWLDSPDGPAWEQVSAERSTLAALRWHPVFGDRAQELVIVTHQPVGAEIEAGLREALLTDAELDAGRRAWLAYPDPFGEWHSEPCGEPDTRTEVPSSNRKDENR